jgi:hypothetical protein
MTNVLYVLTLKKNLIFVGDLVDYGNPVIFFKRDCWISNKESINIVPSGHRNMNNGLYSLGNSLHLNSIYNDKKAILWNC